MGKPTWKVPFGLLGYMDVLQGRDFSVAGAEVLDDLQSMGLTRYDILGTYALPVAFGLCTDLKLALGYTSSKITGERVDEYGDPVSIEPTVSGLLAGGAGESVPLDKFTVRGFVGFGVGVKGKVEGVRRNRLRLAHLLLTYRVAASYAFADNLAAEAGYAHSTYSNEDTDIKDEYGWFSVGVRAAF
ncbi:MAG: hypothetical protein ACM3XZ_03545 [Betaproteobacteria bacterium]